MKKGKWISFRKKLISPSVKFKPKPKKKHRFPGEFRSALISCDEFTHHSDGRKRDEMRNKRVESWKSFSIRWQIFLGSFTYEILMFETRFFSLMRL